MIRLTNLIAALWCVFGAVAMAADRPVVIEMYTSQGCSSCPPADKYFHENLASRDDVIALALHVDYWDYLGWKDNFGSAAFTRRQHDYARASGHRSVYTPQMIVGGRDQVVGNHPYEIKDLIRDHKKMTSPVEVTIKRSGGRFIITATATKSPGPMVVQLVRYRPAETVAIKKGENAGRSLTYANIVDDWVEIAEWDGAAPLRIKAPARGDLPVVAIIQGRNFGPIWAAARLQ